MELKIINKKEDPLLFRTKIEAELTFDKGTPSIAEVKSMLSKDLGKDEKLIVIKNIYTVYGLKKAKNLSYIYENEESLKRIEVQKKEAKSEGAAKKPQEAKKEEKTEQKEAKKEDQKPKETKSEEKSKDQTKEKKQ